MIRQLPMLISAARFAAVIAALVTVIFAASSIRQTLATPRASPAPVPACSVPADLARLDRTLVRTTQRLAAGLPITIVAVGSSSTAGAGASSPAHTYPNRLAANLLKLLPDHPIEVLNRGRNGEEASDMLLRLDQDVLAEKPDLVLWQVGTNSLLRDHDLQLTGAAIHEGLVRLKASGADVVLIDPQFAPMVIAKAEVGGMNSLIATLAKQDNVNLFRRFDVMQNWHEASVIPFETFVTADNLHLNDWGYGCVAKILAGALADAASRPTLTATAIAR
jgi:lysophospholipase L1-like esterase